MRIVMLHGPAGLSVGLGPVSAIVSVRRCEPAPKQTPRQELAKETTIGESGSYTGRVQNVMPLFHGCEYRPTAAELEEKMPAPHLGLYRHDQAADTRRMRRRHAAVSLGGPRTTSATLVASFWPAPVGLCVLIALCLTTFTALAQRHNILLIIADDFATDGLRLYNTNASASLPPMPTVERLAQSGVSFRNAYSYPTCSPTRCTMLTGRYGFRTGIGYALANPLGPTLQADEFTLPKALSSAAPNLRHGMVGKWHLSFHAPDPNTLGGFDWFSGGILGELPAYADWPQKVTIGVTLGNILQG